MQRPRGDNQQRILDYIKSEIQAKGYPPSVREIANAVGLKSTSTVHGHLQRLEKRGLLHRDAMKPRAMEVVGDPNFVRNSTTAVPVVGHVGVNHTAIDVTDVECAPGTPVYLEASPLFVPASIPRQYID